LEGAILEEAYAENAAVVLTKDHPYKSVFTLVANPLNAKDPASFEAKVPCHFWGHLTVIGVGSLDGTQDFAV
jgi:hypothetical protein